MWNKGDGPDNDFSRFRVKFLESGLLQVVGQIGFAKNGTIEGSALLTYSIGEWTDVSLAVNLDAGSPHTVTLTVNGASETINMLTGNAIAGFKFESRGSGGHTVFLDAQFVPVPEPSTLSLLGLGSLAFLARRRSAARG